MDVYNYILVITYFLVVFTEINMLSRNVLNGSMERFKLSNFGSDMRLK